MSKILLINPNIHIVDREKDHYSVMEHLGLGLLAAVLSKNGHEVSILDCYAYNFDNDAAFAGILAFRPDFLGLTANYLNFEDAVEIAERAVRTFPQLYVFVGGEHCTYAAEEILTRHPAIQAVVRGEGEETVAELVEQAPQLHNVKGLFFRDAATSKVLRNPERAGIPELDRLPFADRPILDYCKKNNIMTALGVIAQRGCNFRCKFCNANTFLRMGGGLAIRRRTPQNVADELEYLYDNYFDHGNIEKVYFYDANFIDGSTRSKEWAKALAQEIIARDIVMPFEVYMRGDSLKTRDDDVVEVLKRAGLEAVFIGIESFNANDLEFYGKDITPARLGETLDLLKKHRVLGPTQGVIMFNPYSTDSALIETARFLGKYGYASFWNLSQKLQLFPGVALIEELSSQKLLRGYDRSNKVYSYSFQDPCIETLSGYLLALNQQSPIVRDNALPRHVCTEIYRILNGIEMSGMYSEEVDNITADLRQQLDRNNWLNVGFFEDMIHMHRRSDPQRSIEERTSTYLNELEVCLNALETTYGATLRALHAYVAYDDKRELKAMHVPYSVFGHGARLEA